MFSFLYVKPESTLNAHIEKNISCWGVNNWKLPSHRSLFYSSRSTNCCNRFIINSHGSRLTVFSPYDVQHNHQFRRLSFETMPLNRRLSACEMDEATKLLLYETPTYSINRFIMQKYGKRLSNLDIANMRQNFKSTYNSRSIMHVYQINAITKFILRRRWLVLQLGHEVPNKTAWEERVSEPHGVISCSLDC